MGQTQFRSDDTVKWWLGFGDGSDGAYNSAGNATDAPTDSSCSGTAGTTSLSATNASFANGKPILIHQTRGTGVGNWELNQISSYTAGTITLAKALQNTYTDSGASQAQVIQLKQYSSFTQNSGHTLTAKAWNGNVGGIIAFLCKGTVTITGSLSLTGKGFVATTTDPSDNTAYSGEGTAGAAVKQTTANGNGGGAGVGAAGGSNIGGGGGGGNGAAGSAAQNVGGTTPGAGGAAAGAAALTTMVFGGAGGQAVGGSSTHGFGGSGGGIAFIICNAISIGGTIVLNGNNGGTNADGGMGAGSGAGGSCLIKAITATLGTNKITASAGSVAGTYVLGGAGSVGRVHLDYSGSYTGTTTPSIDVTNDTTIIDVSGVKPFFFAQY